MSKTEPQPHSTRTNYGQCKCLWCNSWNTRGDCPVTAEMRFALHSWMIENGHLWKSKLLKAWMNGMDVGPELLRLRNLIGPSGILKITSSRLERWFKRASSTRNEVSNETV